MGNKGYLFNENVIEWEKGKDVATLSLTGQKFINKVKKLATQYPNECDCHINPNGSVLAHVPLSYIKISHPRQMSEESKLAAADRLNKNRTKLATTPIDEEVIK